MDAERTKIYINYNKLKHVIFSAIAPSLVFLRDSLDKEHFDETLTMFDEFILPLSYWLKHVKKHMKNGNVVVEKKKVEQITEHPDYLRFKEK